MTKKEFKAELKKIGFVQRKFFMEINPKSEYFEMAAQYVMLMIFVETNSKKALVYIKNKHDNNFLHSVLVKETKKFDEKFLNSIKKMVRFFA